MLQWPFLPHWLFVTYRLAVAIYAVVMTILSIVHYEIGHLPWPVWLSNLSYLLLTCHLVCSAAIVVLHTIYKQQQYADSKSIPCNMKFNWFLFAMGSSYAIIVSTLFFAVLFPLRNLDYVDEWGIIYHVMNSVAVILEFLISALPVRLLHVVYVMFFGLAYVLFSIIYWAVDHTHVIYSPGFDWNDPVTSAIVSAIVVFAGALVVQIILFGIYQLRVFIYVQFVEKQINEPPSPKQSSENSSSAPWLKY